MEKIEMANFKAFCSHLALKLENKSLLLYGENGSGKSSIFEAIKLIFYKERLLNSRISVGAGEEQKNAEEESFYNSYRHRSIDAPVEIKVNDTDFQRFNAANYHCYMLSHIDISYMSHKLEDGKIRSIDIINLRRLLVNRFFPEFDTEEFYKKYKDDLINEVNNALKNEFIESLKIGLENEESDIFLEDESHKLRESNGLSTIFNEARLHLVVTLLLLNIILKLEKEEKLVPQASHKIIVLDDIVNSLDAGNRRFIIKYLLSKFGDFQKFIFTHNIGFNNIAEDIIKTTRNENNWLFINLYLTNRGPHLYCYNETLTPFKIEEQFNDGTLHPGTVGNIIRQRFEADINEFCKIIHAGKIELSSSIIKKLCNNKPLYFKKDAKTKEILDANDLVNSIIGKLGFLKANRKLKKIKDVIEEYSNNNDMQRAASIIKELVEIQRHFLHALSHNSTAAMPPFSEKDMKASLLLLKKIEQCLEGLKGGFTQ
ncbi:MAG: ATP-binding protein [Prevotella sp.]|nr:ATP-binding protein [Prevotella sp.]